jgi:uncharacterized protein YrrD
MLREIEFLRRCSIVSAVREGDEIGKVHDVLFDDHRWVVRYLVVDTGGWLSGRRVLVSPAAIESIDWSARRLHVALTREQIENSPSIEADRPVSRQMEIELAEYYQWPTYWSATPLHPVMTPIVLPRRRPPPGPTVDEGAEFAPATGTEPRGDPTLRSFREVHHYEIQATDGSIGEVADLIADEDGWTIRYLVVDTRHWLPGKKVLIARAWIEEISWEDMRVQVGLTRSRIEHSPELPAIEQLTREHERRLHDHYHRPYYWR